MAVSRVPTCGWFGVTVTVPGSSRLVMVIVTVMVSSTAKSALPPASFPSLTRTVTV